MSAFLFVAILLICCQEFEARDSSSALYTLNHDLASFTHDGQKRDIADIWASIKNTATHAWKSIKDIADNMRTKMADWMQKIKIKAQDLGRKFEKRLEDMKDRFNDMISNVVHTSEVVKKCLQQRKQAIDEILKNILIDVTNCISESVTYLKKIEAVQYEPVPNETEFLKNIEDELNVCLDKDDSKNVEECFYSIKKGIYLNMENSEENVLQNHIEKRNATDDLLATIISCTTDGMIKATSVIANETILIVECVSQE